MSRHLLPTKPSTAWCKKSCLTNLTGYKTDDTATTTSAGFIFTCPHLVAPRLRFRGSVLVHPVRPTWPLEPRNAILFDLDAVPLGGDGRDVIAAVRVDAARRDEMLVQVVDELEHVAFHRARDDDVVDYA